MFDATEEDLLAEIAADYQSRLRQPGDLDLGQLARAMGCDRQTADKYMRQREGWVRVENILDHGKICVVWRKAG